MRREARAFVRNVPLCAGALVLLAIGAVAAIGPSLAPYDPHAWRLVEFYPSGATAVPPIRPGPYHWLGTDTMGRDILSRLLWGARLTVAGVVLAVVGRATLGIAIGLAAAWRGGVLDALLRRAIDALAGFPQLMAALLLVVVLKDLGLAGFAIALALVGWPELARFVRAEAARLRAAPFAEAARALGARPAHIAVAHVARNLAPQLAGLLALEAGSALLLLAELGFIGFFISGGTFFVDDGGRPVLPVRDRAPEWGQMLAGARAHAFSQQWVAFVPALVVGAAVVGFNLFGEGLRAALDPFGAHRLSPRTLGALGKGAAALVLVGTLGFAWGAVRAIEWPLEEGAARAREVAARTAPSSELVAAVVRFTSGAHALARPEKLNYYFRSPSGERLRVGFADADANAIEVKPFEDEDRLAWEALGPLGSWSVPWREALAIAERRGGTSYRNRSSGYAVRVALEGRGDTVRYRVRYAPALASVPVIDIPVDARTGDASLSFADYLADAEVEARARLGGAPALLAASAGWWSPQFAESQREQGVTGLVSALHPEGRDYPVTLSFRFGAGSRQALLNYDTRAGLVPSAQERPLNPPLYAVPPADLFALRARFEEAGGREVAAEWERRRLPWTLGVQLMTLLDGRPVAEAFYAATGARPVRYRLDLGTGRVEQIPFTTP